jgi:anti-sigma factor RsiW
MTGCDHIRHDLGGYVLGALEPDEAANVRQHIDRCAKCASEHAALMELPGLLDLAQGIDAAAAPPAAVEERLLDNVARAPRGARSRTRSRFLRLPKRPRRALALGAVGLVCVAAGAAGAAIVLPGDDNPAGQMPSYQVVLKGTSAMPQASARAALETVPGGTSVLLWVSGLTGDPGTVYEVRCDKGHYSISAGTFRADREGRANLTLTTALRKGDYDRIRIVRHDWNKTTRTATQTNVLTGKLS